MPKGSVIPVPLPGTLSFGPPSPHCGRNRADFLGPRGTPCRPLALPPTDPRSRHSMDTTRDLITVFGGIFALLTLASLIGAGLKWRLSPAAPIRSSTTSTRASKAWWAMILLIGAAIWAGKGGVIAPSPSSPSRACASSSPLTHTRLGDHRALLWVFFVFLPLQYALIAIDWYRAVSRS